MRSIRAEQIACLVLDHDESVRLSIAFCVELVCVLGIAVEQGWENGQTRRKPTSEVAKVFLS